MELTPRIIELYDHIQNNITGRFAMWPQDAVAWYNINYEIWGDTLEIGTAWGGSAILANMAKDDSGETEYGDQKEIFTIDPLGGFYGIGKPDRFANNGAGGFPTVYIVEQNFLRFNVKNIQLVVASTPPLPKEINALEFRAVLIDGNHKGVGPLDDWNIVKNRVISGGVVMFHDIHYPEVACAVSAAEKTKGWELIRRYLVKGKGMPSQAQVKGNELYGSHAILRKL